MGTINQRIRELREALGLSQPKFGEGFGVSRDVVKNFEYSKTEPSDLQINIICRQYGVNEHWLRTGEGEMKKDFSADVEFAAKVSELLSDEPPKYAKAMVKTILAMDEKCLQQLTAFMKAYIAEIEAEESEESKEAQKSEED